jgi:hypothetical protein
MYRVYNVITLLFTLATIGALAFIVIQLTTPLPTPQVAEAMPTLVEFPTLTPSNTSTPTQPPTFTPTQTFTFTPTFTPTFTLSATPTLTVAPSLTITNTPLASETSTTTATLDVTATPSATSPSPFLFGKRGDVNYVSNSLNSLGCAWQGIAGQVFDINGFEVTVPYRIHVYGQNYDNYVSTGTLNIYGPSGWEMQVGTVGNTSDTYYVELQSQFGTVYSEPVQVTFPNDCLRNLAIVHFVQVQTLP